MQSRYYNPAIGRFLNADSYASTGQGLLGNNMFAYCDNNPVNSCDPNGEFAIGAILGKAAFGAVVNVATTFVGATITGQNYSWKDAGIAALSGALGTGNNKFKVLAGLLSGLYTGITAYKNGADAGDAILSGAVSAWATTVSVANIAGWAEPSLNLGISTSTDLIFGTAYNSMAAATYRASIESPKAKANVNKQQIVDRSAKKYNHAKINDGQVLRL